MLVTEGGIEMGEELNYEVVCNEKVIALFVRLPDAQIFFDVAREKYDDCAFQLLTVNKENQ